MKFKYAWGAAVLRATSIGGRGSTIRNRSTCVNRYFLMTLPVGVKCPLTVPFNCTIVLMRLFSPSWIYGILWNQATMELRWLPIVHHGKQKLAKVNLDDDDNRKNKTNRKWTYTSWLANNAIQMHLNRIRNTGLPSKNVWIILI